MVRGAAIFPRWEFLTGVQHIWNQHQNQKCPQCGATNLDEARFTCRRREGGGWNGARRAWRDFKCVDVRIKHLEAAFYLLHNSLFIKGP